MKELRHCEGRSAGTTRCRARTRGHRCLNEDQAYAEEQRGRTNAHEYGGQHIAGDLVGDESRQQSHEERRNAQLHEIVFPTRIHPVHGVAMGVGILVERLRIVVVSGVWV